MSILDKKLGHLRPCLFGPRQVFSALILYFSVTKETFKMGHKETFKGVNMSSHCDIDNILIVQL